MTGLSLSPMDKAFLWDFPGCAVRIYLSLELIDRMWAEVLAHVPADTEVGGLLIGATADSSSDVEIFDYVLVPRPSGTDQHFAICRDALAQVLQESLAAGKQVVGYFRTHRGQRVQLRNEDLACIKSDFTDPKNVFLVIRPHDGRASAGFFFWQDASIFGESTLAFPFSAADLEQPYWASLLGGSETRGPFRSVMTKGRDLLESAKQNEAVLTFAAAMLITFAAVVLFVRNSDGAVRQAATWSREFVKSASIVRRGSTGHDSLGLRASREGPALTVTWDPLNPAIVEAKESNLLIWDGSDSGAQFVRLSEGQLHSGRIAMTVVNNKVVVRLDVIGQSESAKVETVASVLPGAESTAPKLAQSGLTSEAADVAAAPKASQEIAPPAPNPTLVESAGSSDNTAPSTTRTQLRTPHKAQTQATVVRERKPDVPSPVRSRIQTDNLVEVRVGINSLGKVTSARMISGRGPYATSLAKYAVEAAYGWHFHPASDSGKPVPSQKVISFLFRPED